MNANPAHGLEDRLVEIKRALNVAEREWKKIRISLDMCGDIGEYGHFDYPVDLNLVFSLIEMDRRITTQGYFSKEAAYAYRNLATKAGERLGLSTGFARAFGSGYSWVRTGWFDTSSLRKKDILKQLFFFKLFFPVGGYFDWDFASRIVRERLKLVFSKFVNWQEDYESYIKDIREYSGERSSFCPELDYFWFLI